MNDIFKKAAEANRTGSFFGNNFEKEKSQKLSVSGKRRGVDRI